MSRFEVVAIDGPAASGKTSIARRVADEMGYGFVSSGLIYRAIAHAVVESGVDDLRPEVVSQVVDGGEWDLEVSASGEIRLNGRCLDAELTASAVNAAVSHVAAVESVRAIVSRVLHEIADAAPVVVEGRDIGSVVFPEASVKLFVDASPSVRATRRKKQGIEDAIEERDRIDSNREIAPLRPAADAVMIDTSDMDIEASVAAALAVIRAQAAPRTED